jgi:hypothetical protein
VYFAELTSLFKLGQGFDRTYEMLGDDRLRENVVFDGISPRDGLTAPDMITIAACGKRL